MKERERMCFRFTPKKSVMFLLLMLMLVLTACGGSKEEEATISIDWAERILLGHLDEDGRVHFVDDKEEIFRLNEGYEIGVWLPASRMFVVVTEEGQIAFLNEDQESVKVLEQENPSLAVVREKGMIYQVEQTWTYEEVLDRIIEDSDGDYTVSKIRLYLALLDLEEDLESALLLYYGIFEEFLEGPKTSYVYLFESDETIKLGDGSYVVADDSLDLIYEEEGKVYILRESEAELERIKSHDEAVELVGISSSGIAVWSTITDSEDTMYAYFDGEAEKLGSYSNKKVKGYESFDVMFGQDSEFIAKGRRTRLYIKTTGEEVQSVQIGSDTRMTMNFPVENGWHMSQENKIFKVDSLDKFYVAELADETAYTWNLFVVDKDGEKEKIVSNVDEYQFYQDIVYYINDSGDLYAVTMDGMKVVEENKVTSDVYTMQSTINPEYIFYLKNHDKSSETGDLYYIKQGEEAVRIKSNVYDSFAVAAGGNSILFFEDIELFDDYEEYGTLFKYSIGDEAPIKVDSDVIADGQDLNNRTDVDSFTYKKYTGMENDEAIFDYYYYNGTEKEKVASGLRLY